MLQCAFFLHMVTDCCCKTKNTNKIKKAWSNGPYCCWRPKETTKSRNAQERNKRNINFLEVTTTQKNQLNQQTKGNWKVQLSMTLSTHLCLVLQIFATCKSTSPPSNKQLSLIEEGRI
ncbi:hypothetical protein Pelo_8519 [Pelomyxa schiedti]|nr:hypothetical protein Pelo_8519 [Pelomyxa schiedti]